MGMSIYVFMTNLTLECALHNHASALSIFFFLSVKEKIHSLESDHHLNWLGSCVVNFKSTSKSVIMLSIMPFKCN